MTRFALPCLLGLFVAALVAAQPATQPATRPATQPATQPAATQPATQPAPATLPGADAIAERVRDSHERLRRTEGGQRMLEAIAAHGGLERWFANGPLRFRWVYHMTDRGPDAKMDTIQIIDKWSSRAWHRLPGDSKITFGWTGDKAWVHPADADPQLPVAFWALTPYYFVGVPFVLADAGTNHELLPEQIAFEAQDYDQVKVTFDPGTGEAPDDYYIVLIHPETDQVKGVRYIVTDPRLGNDEPGPEKLLTYENYRRVQGVLLPRGHRSYSMNGDEVGEQIRHAEVRQTAFVTVPESRFHIPEGARVLE